MKSEDNKNVNSGLKYMFTGSEEMSEAETSGVSSLTEKNYEIIQQQNSSIANDEPHRPKNP